jgi:hypothetical protein
MAYLGKLASEAAVLDVKKKSIQHRSIQRRALVPGIHGPKIYVTVL